MQTSIPLTRDLVLIGGGHTHALVLRKWGMKPLPGVRLTLINPGPSAPYSGMLPGFVAGHYSCAELEIDLIRLSRFAGARWIMDRALGLDLKARQVHLAGRPPVRFDLASLDIGITSELPDLPGFTAHAVPAKPLGRFAERWQAFASRPAPGPVVILGGGVAGAELAMACAHRLPGASVTLVDRSEILSELHPKTRQTLLKNLRALGVRLLPHSPVARITAQTVELADGTALPSEFTIGAAGARAQDWLAETGLRLENGFVRVDAQLRSSDPAVFAVGDCAHLSHAPRPKAGVFAVREAPFLWHNLRAELTGTLPKPYRPQRDYLKLISLGAQRAVADKAGLRAAGGLLWRWKNRIDQRFMQKFTDYPVMPQPALPSEVAAGVVEALGDKPLCAGCGAKVGPGALDQALCDLPGQGRADVLTRAGDDAAVLKIGAAHQVLSTDHLRALTEDPYRMAQIAMVHALGDVWSMGARPQVALSTVILPRMSERLQQDTLAEVTQGALSILTPLGAELVGGHTTLGAEMTLGFTVTGLVDQAVTLDGAQPGDALILTRPIGSGVLLAAEMQGLAQGDHIAALLHQMAQPQDKAAQVLAPHAHAMTDVTGFGLLGHLARMAKASGLGARLDLGAVPIYPGAEDLAARGIKSTLFPANRAQLPSLTMSGPRVDLMFDPQTSGGLLAAVPPKQAEALCAQIDGARIIGEITKNAEVTVC